MSKESMWNEGYNKGVEYAKEHHHIGEGGMRNIKGELMTKGMQEVGNGKAEGFAEGVRWWLGSGWEKEKPE